MTDVLIRRGKLDTDTQTHREEVHMKREAETRMMFPQAQGHQGFSATTRS